MGAIWEFIWRVDTLWYVLVFFYSLACLGLVTIVILQKGKGTGFAGAFGVGPGSETVFGPRGSKSVPVRLTHVLFGIFAGLALIMSLVAGSVHQGEAPSPVEDETASPASGFNALDDLGIQPATPAEGQGAQGTEGPETTPGTTADQTPAAQEPAPLEAPAAGTVAPEPASKGGGTPETSDTQ